MAKNVSKLGIMDNIPDPKSVDTHKHEHTHTHEQLEDIPVTEIKVKPIKSKRIQILTYPSIVRKMDAYAKRNGLSRAEVFELAVTEFLDNH